MEPSSPTAHPDPTLLPQTQPTACKIHQFEINIKLLFYHLQNCLKCGQTYFFGQLTKKLVDSIHLSFNCIHLKDLESWLQQIKG